MELYINDFEEEIGIKRLEGIDFGMLKLFIFLYADDIFLLRNMAAELQNILIF